MKLNLSQISDITLGSVRIEENENGFHFYRFTKEQEELYRVRSEGHYKNTFSTSGVQMRFRTNSQTLFLKAEITKVCGRNYFAFDVFVNGEKLDALNNFCGSELPRDYTQVPFPLGVFSKEFDLGAGEKEVAVYFPWSVKATIKEFTIDDNSFIEPVKPGKKMLCFGDSITQGYDSLYPSNKYTTQLAKWLDAEEFNKAIGGEIFFPELAAAKDAFEPDYITVAYGVNDWHRSTREAFEPHCKEFLSNLSNNYPSSKIFVITPIWCKSADAILPFGEFKSIGEIIQNQAAAFANVFVVQGFEFIPQNEDLFADLRVHPNDTGFAYYFDSLSKHIKVLLQES